MRNRKLTRRVKYYIFLWVLYLPLGLLGLAYFGSDSAVPIVHKFAPLMIAMGLLQPLLFLMGFLISNER